MCVTSPSLTYTSCPQPTAQYGQIDWTTCSASSMRGFSALERGDCTDGPSPRGSPSRSCRRTGQEAILSPSATDALCRELRPSNKSDHDVFGAIFPGNQPPERRGLNYEHDRRTAGESVRGGGARRRHRRG